MKSLIKEYKEYCEVSKNNIKNHKRAAILDLILVTTISLAYEYGCDENFREGVKNVFSKLTSTLKRFFKNLQKNLG